MTSESVHGDTINEDSYSAHAGLAENIQKRMGGFAGITNFWKGVCMALLFCVPNFEHLDYPVEDEATVNVLGMCLSHIPYIYVIPGTMQSWILLVLI